MTTEKDTEHEEIERIPRLQKFFDRPFLLLALGMLVMAVFYTLWGIWEIYSLPEAPLP